MKNNKLLIVIALVMFLTIITFATYAYFATGNLNITNAANINTVTERNNMVFDTIGGEMTLNVTAANMAESLSGNVAAENNTVLTVNFTANTSYSMFCTYDIVYEWTSSDKYTTHTSGVYGNEFTIQGTLASNANVSQGANGIGGVERDLSNLTYKNNSATVVSRAKIEGTGNTMSTAIWTLSSKFYNVNANQSMLSGKTYAGKFKVANVSCTAGNIPPHPTSYWFDTTTCTSSNPCTYPNYGGTLGSTGRSIGHSVYIGQDSSKYYACVTLKNNEVCLSQPYTQYGLDGHSANSSFTSDQQASVKQAIYQAFIDSGVSVDIISCSSTSSNAYCEIDAGYCKVYNSGSVECLHYYEGKECVVNRLGRAYCSS